MKGGFPTRKAAEEALRQRITSVENGTYVNRSTKTLGDFLDEWLENARPRLRETTWYSYETTVKRLKRLLGGVRLQSLTPLQIESAYTSLLASGGNRGGPLAPKTVRNCHIVLHRSLSDAERLGLVSRNAAHSAKAPANTRTEMVTWTAEELAAFLRHVSSDRLYAA